MLHFLIGFYFGGALAVLLGIIGGSLESGKNLAIVLNAKSWDLFVVVMFWPYTTIRYIYNLIR